MHLDAVEAGRKRVPRSLRILRDDAWDLRCLKRAWRRDRFEAVRREGSCIRPNCRWGNRQGTVGLEGRMGDAPDMPKLEHHASATSMDSISHAFPTCDLLGAVDTWRADIALALGRDLGCFRDDEPGAGPLGIIQGAQRSRHIAGAGAASSQGRHDNAVRQRERSNFDWGEEFPRAPCGQVLHGEFSLWIKMQGHDSCRSWRRHRDGLGRDRRKVRIFVPAESKAERKYRSWLPSSGRPTCLLADSPVAKERWRLLRFPWRRRLSEGNRGKPQFRFVSAPEAIQSCEAQFVCPARAPSCIAHSAPRGSSVKELAPPRDIL